MVGELEEAVSSAVESMTNVSNLLEVSRELSEKNIPQVVAYLASGAGREDDQVNDVIKAALADDVVIVPIVRSGEEDSVIEKLPENLMRLNAVSWQDEGVAVITSLLRILGLVEMERKVFISYRQSETREFADQLHTALVQRGFDVIPSRTIP